MASLYIHIPFCERKCIYCDFYSIEGVAPMEKFLDALVREFALYEEQGRGTTFDTVFFGGGTPSLLSGGQLRVLLDALRGNFRISGGAEITLEANPGTVDRSKLASYRALGVNRLSIGVQSFHAADLEFLGRIHDASQARACVADARAAGFDNISLDLIYALPGQSGKAWRRNLEEAVALGVDHISAYSLIVEEHTPLARMVAAGDVVPRPTEEEAGLYEETMDFFFANGYEHYEVSNYARPGFRSRHNCAYWSHENYLSFGPSAHSFWHAPDFSNARRWANVAQISSYSQKILDSGSAPLGFSEEVGARELINERFFLGLRADGIDLGKMARELGSGLSAAQEEIIAALVAEGSVLREGETLRLTASGYMLCDEIAVRLLV